MISFPKKHWPTVIAGFGSPDGDDQAGWRLVDMLWRRPRLPAKVVVADDWMSLLETLKGCRRLIVVDSCRTGGRPGAVVRLRWPSTHLAECHHHSQPAMGICGSLQLAARLGWLPDRIDIFGIEVEDCTPGRAVSPKVMDAVIRLEAKLVSELRETVHAQVK
jgi:hydrogenase maturation protease